MLKHHLVQGMSSCTASITCWSRPPTHPVMQQDVVRWSEAAQLPLCALTTTMRNRRIVDANMAADGVQFRPVVEADTVAAIYAHLKTLRLAVDRGARSWRAVYYVDEACHIWGNGVQGYYEVTADRHQLESTPDYPHAALMHRVLVRMKDCDGAECRTSGP